MNENENTVAKTEEDSLFERYKLIIAARNFHYENFNKWMTYFYFAIGALFIGYYSINDNHRTSDLLYFLVPILGYIVSILWFWACKGYYFWNINFITLVNHYESNLLKFPIDRRVYFVFANKKTQNDYFNPISGANISTSKVALLFSFIIVVVWGVLLLMEFAARYNCDRGCGLLIVGCIAISVLSTIILGIIPKAFLTSKIDHFDDLELMQKKK